VQFEALWAPCTAGKRPRFLQTHAPRPLRSMATTMPYPWRLRPRHGSKAPWDPPAAARGRGCRAAYDVWPTGAGTAPSRVVTRGHRALTGQALEKWRRILSLYCLICVAILTRVRLTVEGCAGAQAVCWRVGVRQA
jgi:hypothetical protein